MNRVLTLAAMLMLSACASHKPYVCKLNGRQPCATMQEIYKASTKAPRNTTSQHVMETLPTTPPYPGVTHNPQGYVEPGENGQPIFKQPRVYRVWLAPYVDADGNLRSGEYTYFSTPGEWAYGTTREAGTASAATFGPQRPDQLGFTPVESQPKKQAPKPDEMQSPPAATTQNGITQPSELLR